MPNSYYFCPFEQIQWNGRTVYAARVLLHLHGEAYRAYRAQTARDYCLAVIENPLPETTAAIQADGSIRTLPITSDDLDRTWAEVPSAARDTVQSWLTERNIPYAWVTGSHTIGDVLRFVVRLHLLVQITGVNFFQGDLSLRYNDFPLAQRNAFRSAVDAWLAQQGRTVNWQAMGLSNNTPLGTVLTVVTQTLAIPVEL